MSLKYLCREAWNMYQSDVLSVSVHNVHRLTLVDLLWFNRSVQWSSPVVQSSEWIHPTLP